MALYRYSVGDRVSRGKGQSSLRSAAYLARETANAGKFPFNILFQNLS